VGDTHEADLLLYSKDHSGRNGGQQERASLLPPLFEIYHQCFWLLDDRERLVANNARALDLLPNNGIFHKRQDKLQNLVCTPMTEQSRTILRRKYPWMTALLLHRDQSVIILAQREIERASRGICIIRRMSDVSQTTTASASSDDSYGIYATKDIKKGQTIFVDTSLLVSVSDINDRCGGCCDNIEGTETNLSCCDIVFAATNVPTTR
jgi:hypothetical protein